MINMIDDKDRCFDSFDSNILFKANLIYFKANDFLKEIFVVSFHIIGLEINYDVFHYIPLLELKSGLKIIL